MWGLELIWVEHHEILNLNNPNPNPNIVVLLFSTFKAYIRIYFCTQFWKILSCRLPFTISPKFMQTFEYTYMLLENQIISCLSILHYHTIIYPLNQKYTKMFTVYECVLMNLWMLAMQTTFTVDLSLSELPWRASNRRGTCWKKVCGRQRRRRRTSRRLISRWK